MYGPKYKSSFRYLPNNPTSFKHLEVHKLQKKYVLLNMYVLQTSSTHTNLQNTAYTGTMSMPIAGSSDPDSSGLVNWPSGVGRGGNGMFSGTDGGVGIEEGGSGSGGWAVGVGMMNSVMVVKMWIVVVGSCSTGGRVGRAGGGITVDGSSTTDGVGPVTTNLVSLGIASGVVEVEALGSRFGGGRSESHGMAGGISPVSGSGVGTGSSVDTTGGTSVCVGVSTVVVGDGNSSEHTSRDEPVI